MNIFSRITLQNLRKNRTRTAVTIVGIALSAALFAAVTSSVSTFLNFVQRYMAYTSGCWYGAGFSLTDEELSSLSAESDVDTLTAVRSVGFAALADCANEYKPYLFVGGIDENASELLPIHLTGGRMPENSSELLLPAHLESNGQITCEIGDVLTLELGCRESGGSVLSNHTGYLTGEDGGDAETLVITSTRTYTVVGFYERPDFEDYSAPGYTALTVADSDGTYTCDVYFTLKNGFLTSDFLEKHSALFPDGYEENYDYLRTMGYSGESNYSRVLYGFAAILIAIIMFGSISLIYNAFSISVGERTKQFGMLSSIGATQRQLRRSVLTEGLFLAAVGIPIGLLVGLIGIGVTFHFIGDMMNTVVGISEVSIIFRPSFSALLVAVLVSLFTILISAYIPARRATRLSAIDAIRQSDDIRIRAKSVRTGAITRRLFGLPGMIAAKNFKRNRKSYRATVISLFVSIVLFISANNLCAYLTVSVGSVYEDMNYDVEAYLVYADNPGADTLDALQGELSGLSGATGISYYYRRYAYAAIDQTAVDAGYLESISYRSFGDEFSEAAPDAAAIYSGFVFVADDTFRQILSANGISEEGYFDSAAPKALCVNRVTEREEDQRYHVYEPIASFADANIRIALESPVFDEDGNYIRDSYQIVPIACDAAIPVPDAPTDTGTGASYVLLFYLPYSALGPLADVIDANAEDMDADGFLSNMGVTFCIQSDNHAATFSALNTYLEEHDSSSLWYYANDYAEDLETSRTMIFIINVFSYGFVILIALIAVANVFNTISTNVLLRRKEFAMLRSVGMTPAGFRRMMNFECILYGCKSLLYGLPVSLLITYLIYRICCEGIEMGFFVAWQSLVIAVGSVFAVVFATMLYSMKKIGRENTVDALKNENL